MRVELVSRTEGVGKYKDFPPEEIIAAIARHGKIKEDNGRLVKYLMQKKHWSPLSMINFGFEIVTSRAMGRHILRHQLAPQESSQRYDSKISFEEIEIRKQAEKNRQSSSEVFDPMIEWNGEMLPASEAVDFHLDKTEELYDKLIQAKVAKETARMILVEATSTTLNLNGCLRNWLTFLNVRTHEDAQKEVRDIANEIGEILEKELPNVFAQIDWRNGLFM